MKFRGDLHNLEKIAWLQSLIWGAFSSYTATHTSHHPSILGNPPKSSPHRFFKCFPKNSRAFPKVTTHPAWGTPLRKISRWFQVQDLVLQTPSCKVDPLKLCWEDCPEASSPGRGTAGNEQGFEGPSVGVFRKIRVNPPKWMVFLNGKPYCKMDDLGGKPN